MKVPNLGHPEGHRPTTLQRAAAATLALALMAACGGGGATVSNPVAAPTITTQPQSQTVTVPNPATFTVTGAGTPAPTYQWYLGATAITGATSASYTTPATSVAMSGAIYTVVLSNGVGTPATSAMATLTVNPAVLSADQQVYEAFSLAPAAASEAYWSLPATGAPVADTNYLAANSLSLEASPSTGDQTVTSTALASLATTLGAVPATAGLPERYLQNGTILVSSSPIWIRKISYPGPGVRVDVMDQGGTTIVQSTLNTAYSSNALSGTVVSAPMNFNQFFNFLFYNTTLLNVTAAWTAGSAYEQFTSTFIGDTYFVFDYATTQTDSATPLPVATGTTIAALMTAGGITVSSDNTTYTNAMGTTAMNAVTGVNTYVGTALRPNRTTAAYVTFYELNGNVYLGQVVKDGTVAGGNPYPVGSGANYTLNYSENFQIRLNQAAVNSLKAAVTF